MKTAIQIAQSLKPSPGCPAESAAPHAQEVDAGTAKVVNILFVQLKGIFPAWRQAWPNKQIEDAAKSNWTRGFMAAGISQIEQIRMGVERCRVHGGDFAPSPGKFIAWCRPDPQALGLPTEDAAWREAVAASSDPDKWRWSHEAVRLATISVGFWDLRQGSVKADVLRLRFSNAYQQMTDRLARGEALSTPMQALQWDGGRNPAELADQYAEQELQSRLRRDGLADTGGDARAALLAKLGIRREVAHG